MIGKSRENNVIIMPLRSLAAILLSLYILGTGLWFDFGVYGVLVNVEAYHDIAVVCGDIFIVNFFLGVGLNAYGVWTLVDENCGK